MARKRTAAYLLAMTLALSAPMMSVALVKPAEAATQTDSQETVSFLNGFFAREEVKKQAGAVAVTVVKNGQVVADRAYGLRVGAGADEARDGRDHVFALIARGVIAAIEPRRN
ncbi:hypothetical protein [Cohnella cholangitidis]|uniref:Serine hydrolase n=1 Tax=Cohnella cholangitidis TaxID=2598458 RepID=A0A7G5BYW5_9BACL|nr:hypothetical protein [Cohnella cholangitidis]QMV42149.1 hypothetical protein FPL14_13800 [Cohnella cholangitidis]